MNNFVFKAEYSWILVPILFLLYFFIPQYVIPLMISVAIIGSIEMLFYDNNIPKWQLILSLIFHISLLIAFFKILDVNLFNIFNLFIFIISIFFILFIPHYPYFMPRKVLLFFFIIIYCSTILFNSLKEQKQ